MDSAETKQKLDDAIAYANAESYTITFGTSTTKGTVKSPAGGEVQKKVTDSFAVNFSTDEDFEFLRWKIVDSSTGDELKNGEYLTLSSLVDTEITCTFTKAPAAGMNLCLIPVEAERPQIISNTPQNGGILKDSSIQVLFDHDMDENSIYYTEAEVIALRKNGIEDSNFLPALAEDELPGNLKNHYGYIKNGLTYYKNISLTNKKTGENLNDKFGAPVFEDESTLTIPASKEEGKIIDDYTQVLVTIEKGFFYSEKIDETTSKPVTLRGIKKWSYQVTNHGDEDALVFQKKNGNDVFTLKLNKEAEQSLDVGTAHPVIGEDGKEISSLNFLKLKKEEDLIEEIEDGKPILYCDMKLQDVAGGTGPNSTFKVYYERIKDYITDGSGIESFDVKYNTTTSEDAIFTGYLALELPSDGTYRIWFDFTDRSQNHFYYPANANEEDSKVGFYVTKDSVIKMDAPEVTDTSDKNDIKLNLKWDPCIDWAKTQIRYKKKDTTDDWSEYKEVTKDTEEYNSLEVATYYDFEIVYTDFAGNTQTVEIYPKSTDFNISITGTPKMTAYLIGEDFDGSGLKMTVSLTKTETHLNEVFWTEDIKQFYNFSSSEECFEGKEVTANYTFKEVTKTAGLTYYVAAADALTQSPVKLTETEYEGTLSGGTYYKFGDFPQTIASSQDDDDYTSDTVRNGWYLNKKDGYFYEKCAEDAFGSGYKYSDGKTFVEQASAKSEKYFKVEPIVWRALTANFDHDADGTGDKILLLAETILTADMPYYDYSDVNRTIGGKTVYPNNYEHSKIRAYLNGLSYVVKTKDSAEQTTDSTYNGKGFLQTAFTSSAQALIADTIVGNSAESTTVADDQATSYACDDTKDKVFLLSVKEATTEAYGFKAYNVSASSRRRFPTDYAMANYAFSYYYSYNGSNNYGGDWWLRSPYYDNNYYYALQITYSGWGYSSNPVSYPKNGIVPALCISAQ